LSTAHLTPPPIVVQCRTRCQHIAAIGLVISPLSVVPNVSEDPADPPLSITELAFISRKQSFMLPGGALCHVPGLNPLTRHSDPKVNICEQ
jgi:hypothetical protein